MPSHYNPTACVVTNASVLRDWREAIDSGDYTYHGICYDANPGGKSRVYYYFDPVKGRNVGRTVVCGAIIEGTHEPLREALPVLEGIPKVVRKAAKRKAKEVSQEAAVNDGSPAAEDADMQPAPKQQRRKVARRAASVAPRQESIEVEIKLEEVPPPMPAHQADFSSLRGTSGPSGDDAFSESSYAFSEASSQYSDATLVAGPSSHGIGHLMALDRTVRGVQGLEVSNEMEEDAEELEHQAIQDILEYQMEV